MNMNNQLVVVEESVTVNRSAYQRIKDWLTKPIVIRKTQDVAVPNSTHWVQCASNRDACPVLPGDERIRIIND